jgi:hypothetical protein
MRTLRELEPPAIDEGFVAVRRIQFQRTPAASMSIATEPQEAVFVAAAALNMQGWERTVRLQAPEAPHLLFEWRPGETVDILDASVGRLSAHVRGSVAAALCPHPGGPPVCWCRPPLPGLILAFARAHGINPSRSTLVGASPAHRTLAATLGARYLQV